MNKVKTRLVAFERAEKMLSEQHEFCPNWLKNSDTVISQSTVKFDYLVLSPPPFLIAYSSLTKNVRRARLAAFKRAEKILSE